MFAPALASALVLPAERAEGTIFSRFLAIASVFWLRRLPRCDGSKAQASGWPFLTQPALCELELAQ